MIRTVCGDINPEKLGVTMCHEHFIVDLSIVRKDNESKIETVEEVSPEIKKMMDLGVNSAIEVTTNDMYRDVKKLKTISEKTNLNIVAATGFYLSEYHPEWLTTATPEEIAEAIIELVDHPEKYPNIRSVGEEYDFTILAKKLISIIEA